MGSCGKSYFRSRRKASQRISRAHCAAIGFRDGHIQLLCELRGNNKRHVVVRVLFGTIIMKAHFDGFIRQVTFSHILVYRLITFCISGSYFPVFEIGDFPSRKGITIIGCCSQRSDHVTAVVIHAGHSRFRVAHGLIRRRDRCRAAFRLIQRDGQRLLELRGKGNSFGRYT